MDVSLRTFLSCWKPALAKSWNTRSFTCLFKGKPTPRVGWVEYLQLARVDRFERFEGEPDLHRQEGVYHLGVELGVLLALDLGYGLLYRPGLFVGPAMGERVEHV